MARVAFPPHFISTLNVYGRECCLTHYFLKVRNIATTVGKLFT